MGGHYDHCEVSLDMCFYEEEHLETFISSNNEERERGKGWK